MIPTMMIPIIVGISVAMQWPLARAMKENLREASLKQGVLIESIEGLETLKAVGGEGLHAEALGNLQRDAGGHLAAQPRRCPRAGD